MAEPTVFEMEIEGVVHPIEDKTARQAVEKLQAYSTTEQDTGKTWTDGKKIYRRVINETATTFSDTPQGRRLFYIEPSIPNMDSLVQVSGMVYMRPFGTQEFYGVSLGFTWMSGDLSIIFTSGVFRQPGGYFYIDVAVLSQYGVTSAEFDVTIEYTKNE